VELRPHTAGSELLELKVLNARNQKVAAVIFATILDRQGRRFLSVRDQETIDLSLRQKRLMTLLHLFLIHRYKTVSVHYVSPTDDNEKQCAGMQRLGIYDEVRSEVGQIIVATINGARVKELLEADRAALGTLIAKT
jgi:isocitrate lyase